MFCRFQFRFASFTVHSEPVKGFLSRYLRRKWLETDAKLGKSSCFVSSDQLMIGRIIDWIPKVSVYLNRFLENLFPQQNICIGMWMVNWIEFYIFTNISKYFNRTSTFHIMSDRFKWFTHLVCRSMERIDITFYHWTSSRSSSPIPIERVHPTTDLFAFKGKIFWSNRVDHWNLSLES